MEIAKTLIYQSKMDKLECNWGNQASRLQTILQSYSHLDSMILAQKQKYRPMEQNRKPRKKSPHTYGHVIFDKGSKNIQ